MRQRAQMAAAVDLSPEVVAKLSELAQAALPLETGGVLLGWYQQEDIHVADAIPVPDPYATPTSYHRGQDEGNSALAEYMARQPADTPIGYVGEWHSHPGPAGPSPLDTFSFLGITELVKQSLVQVVMTLQGDGWGPVVRMSRSNKRFGRRRRS